MDEQVDLESLQLARELISDLPNELIPENVMQFLLRKKARSLKIIYFLSLKNKLIWIYSKK